MRLNVYAFGRLKTPGLRDAADHYLKLIQPWVTVEELELKPLSVPDKSPATRRQIQEKEGAMLLPKLSGPRSVYYLLDEGGKELPTQKWAEQIRRWESESIPTVSLCIGSSLGFAETVRAQARGILSLGPQTFSYELTRVVLLEQLYRAWSVVRGHPYHNDGS